MPSVFCNDNGVCQFTLPPEIFDKPDYLDNPHIQLVVPPSEMARVFGVDAGSAVAPSPVKTPL